MPSTYQNSDEQSRMIWFWGSNRDNPEKHDLTSFPAAHLLLVYCLAYCSKRKMEVVRASETLLDFYSKIQKILPFFKFWYTHNLRISNKMC
jgi:hypothetical protein